MKLNKIWKLIIGIATALITTLPLFFFIGWMGFMLLGLNSVEAAGSTTPDIFVYMFLLLIATQIFWGFLRIAMVVFYQAHAIMNEKGSMFLRILLSIGNFLVPFISMPVYYFVFIYPDTIPNWALENPITEADQIKEIDSVSKKPKAKKKISNKIKE